MVPNSRVMLWANLRRGPSISVPSPYDGDQKVPWWYDKIGNMAHVWGGNGVNDILFPNPLKTNAGAFPGADGYGVFDDYDIGSKNTVQFGGPDTRFGNAEKLRRAIAICRANGMDVHIDHVMHQRIGGNNGVYRYLGADGKMLNGRFPKDPACFRGSSPRVPEDPVPDVPDDFSFGDELAPINAKPHHYVWDGLIEAGDWLFRTTGAQGARLDDMKGMAVEFINAWMNTGAMKSKFFFGEYASGNPDDLNWWVGQVNGRASALDFGFHYNWCQKMCNNAGGSFSMKSLNNRWNVMLGGKPMHAVPFVESMDSDTNGFATVVSNKVLGYALLLGGEGLPMVYVRDYLQEPDCYGLKPYIDNLMWCSRNLANGPTTNRYADDRVFAFERTGHPGLLVTLNSDVWNPEWHTVSVQTSFGANVQLHDYSGRDHEDVWTDNQGRVTIRVPPGANGFGYGFWSRAGLSAPIHPPTYSTTQEFFGAADLDTPPAMNGTQTVSRIWCGQDHHIEASLTADRNGWSEDSSIEFQIIAPNGEPSGGGVLGTSGESTQARATAPLTGWHTIKLISNGMPATGSPFTFKVNYTASRTLASDQF